MWGRQRPRARDDSTVFIGHGSEIDGRCGFPGLAIVEGRITGDLVTAGHLVVGESGVVTSVVRATVVTVKGTITGMIVASERVELLATARVTGDIEAPALTIEAGAVLDGRCHSVREVPAVQTMALPASTSNAVPVMNEDSAHARNTIG